MEANIELPKLPEGQDSYAGIPKAVFVVSHKFIKFFSNQNFPNVSIFNIIKQTIIAIVG